TRPLRRDAGAAPAGDRVPATAFQRAGPLRADARAAHRDGARRGSPGARAGSCADAAGPAVPLDDVLPAAPRAPAALHARAGLRAAAGRTAHPRPAHRARGATARPDTPPRRVAGVAAGA